MKTALLVVCAGVSVTSAGVAVLTLQSVPEAPTREVALAPAHPSDDSTSVLASLERRIEALQAENRMLLERVEDLETAPAVVAPATRAPVDGFATRRELEALRAELGSVAAVRGEDDLPLEEALREKVAESLSEIRREEKVEAVRDYQEKRRARLDQDLARMQEWLSLEPYQVDEMRVILSTQYEREDEQRRLWEEGTDDDLLVERKRTDGELFWEEVSRTLDAEQYETFRRQITGGK